MSDSYANSKVRDALRAAQGNRARAQRLLLGLVEQDDMLLRGLARPFLKAIVTAAIERATRDALPAAPPAIRGQAGPRPLGRTARTLDADQLDSVLAQLGRAPAPAAGREGAAPPPVVNSPTVDPATVRRLGADQASTMMALAAAVTRKRDR